MSNEASSALTFSDLLLEIGRKMGVAYYGDDGTEAAQVPVDDHDLAECKRHANSAIRMFIADAPPSGWRWVKPTATVYIWPSLTIDAAKTLTSGTYDFANDQTLVTANAAVFYESMEEKTIAATVGGNLVIKTYVSSTQVYVYGDHHSLAATTFTVIADGNYTLPRTFAGSFSGEITFGSATNRAVQINWTDEATIRQLRENVTINEGIPRYLAVEVFIPTSGRRRYRVMSYPIPYQLFTIQFPFDLHFDKLVNTTDPIPTPIMHDETIRAACLAVVERDVEDMSDGPSTQSYIRNLQNSFKLDARSAPRKLGYFGNDRTVVTPRNFREYMKRPNVTYNTP